MTDNARTVADKAYVRDRALADVRKWTTLSRGDSNANKVSAINRSQSKFFPSEDGWEAKSISYLADGVRRYDVLVRYVPPPQDAIGLSAAEARQALNSRLGPELLDAALSTGLAVRHDESNVSKANECAAILAERIVTILVGG